MMKKSKITAPTVRYTQAERKRVSDRVMPGVVWAPVNLGDELVRLFDEPGVLPRVRVVAADRVAAATADNSQES